MIFWQAPPTGVQDLFEMQWFQVSNFHLLQWCVPSPLSVIYCSIIPFWGFFVQALVSLSQIHLLVTSYCCMWQTLTSAFCNSINGMTEQKQSKRWMMVLILDCAFQITMWLACSSQPSTTSLTSNVKRHKYITTFDKSTECTFVLRKTPGLVLVPIFHVYFRKKF